MQSWSSTAIKDLWKNWNGESKSYEIKTGKRNVAEKKDRSKKRNGTTEAVVARQIPEYAIERSIRCKTKVLIFRLKFLSSSVLLKTKFRAWLCKILS